MSKRDEVLRREPSFSSSTSSSSLARETGRSGSARDSTQRGDGTRVHRAGGPRALQRLPTPRSAGCRRLLVLRLAAFK